MNGWVLWIFRLVAAGVLLPVGYMKDAVLRPARRKPPHEVTYWNVWGGAAPR